MKFINEHMSSLVGSNTDLITVIPNTLNLCSFLNTNSEADHLPLYDELCTNKTNFSQNSPLALLQSLF